MIYTLEYVAWAAGHEGRISRLEQPQPKTGILP
jgi:hypothetical protein